MRAMVKRRGYKAGINDLYPHLLRHTCLTVWISKRRLDQDRQPGPHSQYSGGPKDVST
jgi:integrase